MFCLTDPNPDKLFFTSDTHFDHFNIAKYCHRPFASRSEMNQALVEKWNSVVPEDGIVIHCGDFMLPHKEDSRLYLKHASKLNGEIYLCRGNHDMIKTGINEFGIAKFRAIVDMMIVSVEGIKILACHFPLLAYPTDFHVFGHIHTLKDGTCHGIDGDVATKLRPTQYDVGVDQNDYTPVSYWQLAEIFKLKACGRL